MKALPKDLRYLLFDLDGTLTDSAEGILRCVQYALEQCGTPEPDAEKLRPFIGPPLLDSFQEFCGMPPCTKGFSTETQTSLIRNLFSSWSVASMTMS